MTRLTFLVLSIAALATGALSAAACSSEAASSGFNDCVELQPDGGSAGFTCQIGFLCNSETQYYELQCVTDVDGNYSCDCVTDTVVTRTFKVNPFTCSGTEARSAGNAGCGWQLQEPITQ